jgi:hypothetical protein
MEMEFQSGFKGFDGGRENLQIIRGIEKFFRPLCQIKFEVLLNLSRKSTFPSNKTKYTKSSIVPYCTEFSSGKALENESILYLPNKAA